MRTSLQSQKFARQLFSLSLADGQVSAARVEGVLAYLSKHPPRQPLVVLRRYQRLVATQLAKNRALLDELEAGNTAGGDVFPETQSEIDRLKAS